MRRLGDPIFAEAIGVLEMIAKTPRDRQLYEARVKMQRDEKARLEAAILEGLRRGRAEGRTQGLAGLAEGKAKGIAEGEARGRLRVLLELLNLPQANDFDSLSIKALEALAGDLKQQIPGVG
jgi:flagellar biosynthesis/type III secretory pathway protein FliH